MPYITTSRGDFYAADHRVRGQPPLLLIHGAGGTRLDWSMPVRRLGALALDLSGHGKSSGAGHETIAAHADDLLAVLDALDIPRAFVCGHSMGGAIALTLALARPDRLRGVILLATGAKLRVHPDLLAAEADPQTTAARLASWLWAADTPQPVRERGIESYLAQSPQVIARDFRACDAFDVRDQLDALRLPALVLCGTADQMTPLHFSQYLVDHITGAELRTYDGAGHNVQIERPLAVAEDIGAFMARITRS